jgi:thioredoxin 1
MEIFGAMLKIRKIGVLLALLLGSSLVAQAGQPFDAKAFHQSQIAGKTILVDVAASWCPTCRQQRPIVQEIEKETPSLVVYEVDFDTAKDTQERFNVRYQSTLIIFKGAKEVGRSTGVTDPNQIRALIAQGF